MIGMGSFIIVTWNATHTNVSIVANHANCWIIGLHWMLSTQLVLSDYEVSRYRWC